MRQIFDEFSQLTFLLRIVRFRRVLLKSFDPHCKQYAALSMPSRNIFLQNPLSVAGKVNLPSK